MSFGEWRGSPQARTVDSSKVWALCWMCHEDNKGMGVGQSQLDKGQTRL